MSGLDPMDAFFDSLRGKPLPDQVSACAVEIERLEAAATELWNRRGNLPRNAKAEAAALLAEWHAANHRTKRVRKLMKDHRQVMSTKKEKAEAQHLWAAGVREICGQEALDKVYDWMAVERRRRQDAASEKQS